MAKHRFASIDSFAPGSRGDDLNARRFDGIGDRRRRNILSRGSSPEPRFLSSPRSSESDFPGSRDNRRGRRKRVAIFATKFISIAVGKLFLKRARCSGFPRGFRIPPRSEIIGSSTPIVSPAGPGEPAPGPKRRRPPGATLPPGFAKTTAGSGWDWRGSRGKTPKTFASRDRSRRTGGRVRFRENARVGPFPGPAGKREPRSTVCRVTADRDGRNSGPWGFPLGDLLPKTLRRGLFQGLDRDAT